MNKVLVAMFIALLGLVFGLAYYQGKVTRLKGEVSAANKAVNNLQDTIGIIRAKNKVANEIDIKYAKELADAKSENDRLRADVESGSKRLHVNASCKVPNTSTTSIVDDATSPRLNESAQRDYLNLREWIGTATKQIAGLQEYVERQCVH